MLLHTGIFLVSAVLLYISGKWLVDGLSKVAFILKWRKFVLSFIVMAFAASLSNLFVGISSAIHKIPELSFGDIVGGNVVDLTLAIALAAFFAHGGIKAHNKVVQKSAIFAVAAAMMPLLLALDKTISRADGIILIILFGLYLLWLFSKDDRFKQVYSIEKQDLSLKMFLGSILKIAGGIGLILIAAEGIVRSALFFADTINVPLITIGILIVGLGNSLPEIYFAIFAAKKGETDMVLGDILSAIIVPATMVLGVVAIIHPIEISDFSPFAVARIFLVIAAILFIWFVRSGKSISKKEGFVLLAVYLSFILFEVII